VLVLTVLCSFFFAIHLFSFSDLIP
jgi:hypothetical protein